MKSGFVCSWQRLRGQNVLQSLLLILQHICSWSVRPITWCAISCHSAWYYSLVHVHASSNLQLECFVVLVQSITCVHDCDTDWLPNDLGITTYIHVLVHTYLLLYQLNRLYCLLYSVLLLRIIIYRMQSKPLTFPHFWLSLFVTILTTWQTRHIFKCMAKGISASARVISASGEFWSSCMTFWPPRTVTP